MIYSMTAFAKHAAQGDWGRVEWELRSVNHRYLELQFRLPDYLRALEPKLREIISGTLQRGKVECTCRFLPGQGSLADVQLNRDLAGKLTNACYEIEAMLSSPAPVDAMDILRWPGVMSVSEELASETQDQITGCLEQAVQDLAVVRQREGDKLKAAVSKRLTALKTSVDSIQERAPELQDLLHTKLSEKVKKFSVEVEQERLAQELVLLLQKADVAEELDRLEMHCQEVAQSLEKGGVVGRRLDFLMQELNRETNTLGAKSNDSQLSNTVVEMKVLVEQMREQIQNIE